MADQLVFTNVQCKFEYAEYSRSTALSAAVYALAALSILIIAVVAWVCMPPSSPPRSPLFPPPSFPVCFLLFPSFNLLFFFFLLLFFFFSFCVQFVIRHRSHPVIRSSSFKFCLTMLAGATMMGVFVVLRSALPPSTVSCAVLPWIAHIAFALNFYSLFAKVCVCATALALISFSLARSFVPCSFSIDQSITLRRGVCVAFSTTKS